MTDPRISQLARQLVRYSTTTKRGDNVLVDLYDTPDEMAIALIREIRAVKATPFVTIQHAPVQRELFRGATVEQLGITAKLDLAQMKHMDVYIAIRGSHNITELSDVPADRLQLVSSKMRPVLNHRVNKTRWTVLRWPHPAMAQQAGMSTEQFEDLFFRVCLLDYSKLLPGMRALKRLMDKADEVHLKGRGTDLRFSIKDIQAIACAGTHNIPDGEVFTAPVKTSIEGHITFNAPTIYRGVAFDNIRLEYEKGKVVAATANNTKELNRILDSDAGARYVGEFAIGVNNEIKQPMRDILFDEKIGGSFHMALGQAYEDADNGNRSSIHWDMVMIQTPECGGGEIYFDDVLVRKDGLFVLPELEALNPENLQ
jgi:aminopeptidase